MNTNHHKENNVMSELTLERRSQTNQTAVLNGIGGSVMIAPVVDEDYWSYRVRLSDTQAVLGFPKFNTIGIGFAVEDDENTNLPYSSDTDRIFEHIICNKGDDSISDDDVRSAIVLIQAAAVQDRFVDEHIKVIHVPTPTGRLSERDPRTQSIPRPGEPRSLRAIAQDIQAHWNVVAPAAKPYVHAMLELNSIDDKLMAEKGRDIVAYFLANCGTWRGTDARRIKDELRAMVKR